jgi:MarR family transcriptional regulator, organic hydroperoxide resistance regulator
MVSRRSPSRINAPPSPVPGELPDVLLFMRSLWAIVHGLQKVSKRMSNDIGVTGPQRLVLRVVGMFPGLSAGALASILHVHPSTLTGVLQRLVAQRLVTRSAEPGDRRRAVLHLTDRGVTVNAITEGTVEAAVRDALRTISDRDRGATMAVLAVLAAQLERPGRQGLSRGRRGARKRTR